MTIKELQDSTTSTLSSSGVLTIQDIKRAIKALEEASKRPFIVSINSRYEWWKLYRLDTTARTFVFGGVPLFKDASIPKGIARMYMSDGTYTDHQISNEVKYLK